MRPKETYAASERLHRREVKRKVKKTETEGGGNAGFLGHRKKASNSLKGIKLRSPP